MIPADRLVAQAAPVHRLRANLTPLVVLVAGRPASKPFDRLHILVGAHEVLRRAETGEARQLVVREALLKLGELPWRH